MTNRAFVLSFLPIIGGLSIIKESDRLGHRTIKHLGWAIFALSLVIALVGNIFVVWLLQIYLAIWLKIGRTQPPMPAAIQQVDFNTCSKHDLVYVLNLPIVYANDIELIRSEGYLFTHLEEISAIAGLPEAQVRRIAPQVIFSYNTQIDENHTWRQVNILTAEEMAARGVMLAIAQQIVEERIQRGDYRSAVDIKRRTGIAFQAYQQLV